MQPHQQQHQISDPAAADPSTPASTAASTMTSGSAASTPLLPSTASLLSPVAFHIPALSQSQGQGQNMGSNLASPPSEPQPGALQPLGMHALSWTTTPATPERKDTLLSCINLHSLSVCAVALCCCCCCCFCCSWFGPPSRFFHYIFWSWFFGPSLSLLRLSLLHCVSSVVFSQGIVRRLNGDSARSTTSASTCVFMLGC